MSSSLPPDALSTHDFVCECKTDFRSACAGLPFFKEHEGKRYCVLHYRARDKRGPFDEALRKKLADGDFNFRGVWFPDDLDIRWFTFETRVDCWGAVFNGETVLSRNVFAKGADFHSAEFVKDVYFSYAKFCGEAIFDNTRFEALAYFRRAKFHSLAKFESATFCGEADFSVATFRGEANFGYTTCVSYLKFSSTDDRTSHSGERSPGFADGSSFEFQFANVEKPERISFNTLSLRPHWFVNVDPRKFDFVNVTWPPRTDVVKGCSTIVHELESLQRKNVAHRHRRLAVAYRQLALNAEENHRYGEASDFRYQAMDARSREKARGHAFWKLGWWYWLASGYGESAAQAAFVLIFLWALFAIPYRHVGFVRWEPRVSSAADAGDAKKAERDEVGKPLGEKQALAYSFGTMTLQRPEPRPATAWAHFFVILQTILGPVQAALLALAIRRKFMR